VANLAKAELLATFLDLARLGTRTALDVDYNDSKK